jgi:outer membrane protein OmpA-like peptidoglycan-associated protein
MDNENKPKKPWRMSVTVTASVAAISAAALFAWVYHSTSDGFLNFAANSKFISTEPRSDLSEPVQSESSDFDANNSDKVPDVAVTSGAETPATTTAPIIVNPWDPRADPKFTENTSAKDVGGSPISTVEPTENTGEPNTPDNMPSIVLTQEIAKFKPDTAEFVNSDEAEKVIAVYADGLREYIAENPLAKIYVIGTAADTWSNYPTVSDIDNTQKLSEQRACAVLDVLIKLGVPEKSLFAFGMRNQDPWHTDNLVDGVFDTETAKKNRKVVAVMSGEDAAQLVNPQLIKNGETHTMFWYENGELKTAEFDKLF